MSVRADMKAWKDLTYLLELQLSRRSMIVRVIIVLNWTVFVDSDWHFDNLCGSHLHWSQGELYHVSSMLFLLIKWLLGRNLSQFFPNYLCNFGLFDIFLSVHSLAFFDWSRFFLIRGWAELIEHRTVFSGDFETCFHILR